MLRLDSVIGKILLEKAGRVAIAVDKAGRDKLIWGLYCAASCLIVQAGNAQCDVSRLSSLPHGIEVRSGNSVLDVQILENYVADVHVRPDERASPRTLVMDPQPRLHAPADFSDSDRNGICTLVAPGISIDIKERAPFSLTFKAADGRQLLESLDPFSEASHLGGVSMMHAGGETLYGIHGLSREVETPSLTRQDGGKVEAGAQGNSGAPFVFTASYGLLVDSDGGEFTSSQGRLIFQHDSRPDVEYFVIAGLPLQTLGAMSRLVGPPPMPPKWTLGFLNSQWGTTESEVKNIVGTYRRKQIPLDGFILDFDWKAWGEDDYGEWRWNSTSGPGNVCPDKFPDGASGIFAKRLAAKGVKLAGILKPRILTTVAGNPNQPTEAAAYATKHHLWYPTEDLIPDYYSRRMARDLDFNNPETRSWYWEHLRPAFSAGMVAWWNDEADWSGKTIFNNFQFLNMGRMLYEGQRADSSLRVWSINRNFYLGASRYGYAGWSGDIKTGFASMAYQRSRMLAALDTGEFHWSMDTGGFVGRPDPENYARWVEFAALVPIMRVHGGRNQRRQPWVYGPIAEVAARKAIDLRYKLLPYIYSYERLNTEGEVGLVRPLFWEFPSDPGSATVDTEWMFGDALLAAPIVAPDATSKTVYLPPGKWFDYWTGRPFAGGTSIQLPIDSATWKDIPLYVRSGSIIATQPVEQYVGQHPIKEITLDIFPSQSAASFTSYDDDGRTYNYERGAYMRQEISAVCSGKEIKISLGAATGTYASQIHTYLVRIHATGRSVLLNGERLRQARSGSLPGVSEFVKSVDKFGPVIVVRVAAGSRVSYVLTVQ